jgi:hypothetical protein
VRPGGHVHVSVENPHRKRSSGRRRRYSTAADVGDRYDVRQ